MGATVFNYEGQAVKVAETALLQLHLGLEAKQSLHRSYFLSGLSLVFFSK
jgi:hypothetical protein